MKFYGGNLENDCIAILNWCYRNQSRKQSYRVFADELGIPLGTLHRIIKGFTYFGESHWALATYAKKYGYDVTFIGHKGSIIWVDKRRPHLENPVMYNEDGELFQI